MSTGETAHRTSRLSGLPLVVAVVAIGVWIAFVIVMVWTSNADETQWVRLTFVFASVEALAFAAAGALFGVTVQRERVEKAEERAEANARDASNGRALALMYLADEDRGAARPASAPGLESLAPDDDADRSVRRRHAEAARRLFPDLSV